MANLVLNVKNSKFVDRVHKLKIFKKKLPLEDI